MRWNLKRPKFSRKYQLVAVKQLREPDVSAAQVARDFGIGLNVVSRWVREASGDIRRLSRVRVDRNNADERLFYVATCRSLRE